MSVAVEETHPFTVLQDPDEPFISVNTPINLTILNNLEIAINTVVLHYCRLEPDFICHFPGISLEKNSYDFYSVVFTPEYGENTTLGYNFEITLENGSVLHIPNSLEYSSTHFIHKASDNLFYFSVAIVEAGFSTINSTSSSRTAGFSILIILSLLTLSLIKNRTKAHK
jgi:hypothetical protein